MNHYILSAIGTNPRMTTYLLGDETASGSFSSSTLPKLLNHEVSRIFVLCTQEAKKAAFPIFSKEVDIVSEPIDIPNGTTPSEIQSILRSILTCIPSNCNLTIDITNGFRHYPFLLFSSSLYLSSFKDVTIRGIWYGMFENKDEEGRTPFVDMRVLIDIIEWFHHVKNFTDETNSTGLAQKFEASIQESNWDQYRIIKSTLSNLTAQLHHFSENYGAGLPLELGGCSKSFTNQFRKKKSHIEAAGMTPIPLLGELLEYAAQTASSFSLEGTISTRGEWKRTYSLTMDEIRRQCRIIDQYLQDGQYVNAIRLMREWIINRCLLSQYKDSTETATPWLDRTVRLPVERQLGALSYLLREKLLDQDKVQLAQFWDQVSDFRNSIAHNGMRAESVSVKDQINKVLGTWDKMNELVEDDDYWNPFLQGGGGVLLITPLGLSKGLLYTALKRIEPDHCLLITSHQAAPSISEIIKHADYHGQLLPQIVLHNPYSGFDEIPEHMEALFNEYSSVFLNADSVVVNLTGGTTTMQYFADLISQRAVRMGLNVDKVGMIDKRKMEDQRNDPYVLGERIQLMDYYSLVSSER